MKQAIRKFGMWLRGDGKWSVALSVALVLNIAFWTHSRDEQPAWGNVPPAPGVEMAAISMGGDAQLAYRIYGLMLQNLGDIGGRTTVFDDYNYAALRDWFFVEDGLDPVSNFMPSLVAYYYGATRKVEDLTPVIDYLAEIGVRPEPQKWRWLAHAAFLARYSQNDLERAFDLATILSDLSTPDMPAWARQMPAFILVAQGDKEAAYEMLMGMLKTSGHTMEPSEVRMIRDWICEKILSKADAATHPVCISIPGQ